MTNDQSHPEPTTVSGAHLTYDPPRLTVIGEARDVILGVLGSGDDYFGYTFPGFEFEPDNDELPALRRS